MSFVNPLFLIGLSAALLPVLYHLIRRMQARKVAFSSIRFITATPKQVVRKRRLRDILLMTVRMALFALLAVAFARPFVPKEKVPFMSERQDRSTVLLVDASYSMGYGDRLERARREAMRVIDEAGANDEVAIVAFSDRARRLTDLTNDRTVLRAALQKAFQVDYRPTDFYRPLRMAEDLLREARHARRQIVLISDFQRNGWSGSLENWKLDRTIAFRPVSVGSGEPDNAYVQALQLTPVHSGLRFDARVAAQGEQATRANTATLFFGGRPVERMELDARPSSRVTLQHALGREKVVQGELTIAADDLPADNRYYFTHTVQGKPSILCIDGVAGGYARDAFFLESAFSAGGNGQYAFKVASPMQMSRSELQQHGMVIVANVSGLNAAQAGALRSYMERGGSVVVSFGAQSDPGAWTGTLRSLGIGTVERPENEAAAPAVIGEVDLRHPVFDVFVASGSSIILHPEFRHYLRVTPAAGTRVVGRFDNGDPFLLERQVGAGRIIVYTSSFSTGWTDFPIREMFVPFVYQVARYAFNAATHGQNYTVGDVISLQGQPGAGWEVRTPSGRLLRVRAGESGHAAFRETDEPGHYTAASPGTRVFFSVNVNPIESDLQVRDVEEAYALVAGGSRTNTGADRPPGAAVDAPEGEREIWKLVLLTIIALFVLESILANRRLPALKPPPPVVRRGGPRPSHLSAPDVDSGRPEGRPYEIPSRES